MSTPADWSDLGVFPLQDHDGSNPPLEIRQQLVGGRIGELRDAKSGDDFAGIVHWAKEDDHGTLGDMHPWRYWPMDDRSKRPTGAWQAVFGAITSDPNAGKTITPSEPGGAPRGMTGPGDAVPPGLRQPHDAGESGGGGTQGPYGLRGGPPTVHPIRSVAYDADPRFKLLQHEWPECMPSIPKGTLMLAVAGTEERSQENLLFHADPRLVAPNAFGPANMGTLVYDLQPVGELCVNPPPGRGARLQSMMRVVVMPDSPPKGLPVGRGNGLAWQLAASGQDWLPGYGLVIGKGDMARPPQTTPGEDPRPPVITPGDNWGDQGTPYVDPFQGGTSGGGGTDVAPTPVAADAPQATREGGTESGGGGSTLSPGDSVRPGIGGRGGTGGEQSGVCTTGRFAPKQSMLVASFAAAVPTFGPLHPGHFQGDKHTIGKTKDREAMTSLHISTRALFYHDMEKDGPLHFEPIRYPKPGPLPGISRVHLSWDPTLPHEWIMGQKDGKWRWFAEVPFFIPQRPPGDDDTPGDKRPPPPTTPGEPNDPTTPGEPDDPNDEPSTPGPVTPGPDWGDKGTPYEPGGEDRPNRGGGGGTTVPGRPSDDPTGGRTEDPGGNVPNPGAGDDGGGGFNPDPGGGYDFPSPGVVPPDDGDPPPNDEDTCRDPGQPNEPETPSEPDAPITPSSLGATDWGGFGQAGAGGTDRGVTTKYGGAFHDAGARGGYARLLGMTTHVGDVDEEWYGGLFLVHHPLLESYTEQAFRPQLNVRGYPDFTHNAYTGTRMQERDEQWRPQVVGLRSWGAEEDGEWAYAVRPMEARARGGQAHGGIVYTAPNVDVIDLLDGENSTTDGDGGALSDALVGYAPGVRQFYGRPHRDGGLQSKSVRVYQDPLSGLGNEPLLFDALDAGRSPITIMGLELDQSTSERMVTAYGEQAIQIPYGPTATRPAALGPLPGQVRVNADVVPGQDTLEWWDSVSATWLQAGTGGGGGVPDTAAVDMTWQDLVVDPDPAWPGGGGIVPVADGVTGAQYGWGLPAGQDAALLGDAILPQNVDATRNWLIHVQVDDGGLGTGVNFWTVELGVEDVVCGGPITTGNRGAVAGMVPQGVTDVPNTHQCLTFNSAGPTPGNGVLHVSIRRRGTADTSPVPMTVVGVTVEVPTTS